MSTTGAFRRADPQTVIEEFRVLLAKNVQGNVRLFNRISALVKEAARDLGSGSSRMPQGNELLNRWLDLNFAYYSLLTEHGIAFIDELLSAAERTLGIQPAVKQEEQTDQNAGRIGINLSARSGEVAVAPFVIENRHSSALEVSFRASDFVSLKAETVSAELIKFEPSSLLLQPQEQHVIQAVVNITDEFKVGETYATSISVLGFQAKEIGLVLTILPPLDEKKHLSRIDAGKKPRARKKTATSARKTAKSKNRK